MEAGACVVTDKRLLGYGNEHGVRELLELDGVVPEERKVLKEANNAFFGWQTPRYEDVKRYLDVLEKHGVPVRESVELLEAPEIERERTCTRWELLKSLGGNLSIGFILKLLTKQFGRKSNYAIVEDYCDDPPLKMNVLDDERLSEMLVELLKNCEKILEDEGLFVDPLGGAAISASLKYLVNPSNEPILSNLREEGGKIVVTDFGVMDVRNTENVYGIPHTAWAMEIALASLGHLAFEAMNMAFRGYGHDIEPRPLKPINTLPKVFAWLGFNTMNTVKGFWESGKVGVENIDAWIDHFRRTIPV
jgi:hypothetical protein